MGSASIAPATEEAAGMLGLCVICVNFRLFAACDNSPHNATK
jgi:hypothetical protein